MNAKTSFLLSALLVGAAYGQKKPLDHSVYDGWKSLSHIEMSKSGRFVHYRIEPQEGDGLFELKTARNEPWLSVHRATDAALTRDETFLVATLKPTFEQTRQAKIEKKKTEDMPMDSLIIVDMQTKSERRIPEVKSFKLARLKNEYVAFLTEQSRPSASETDSSKTVKPKKTPLLVLQNLATGDTAAFPMADQYAWSPNEDLLVFTKKPADKDSLAGDAGLYLYRTADRTLKKISSGKGTYRALTFDDHGTRLSFLADKSPEKSLMKDFKLYHYTPALDSAVVLADQNSAGVPQNWYVSGDGKLTKYKY